MTVSLYLDGQEKRGCLYCVDVLDDFLPKLLPYDMRKYVLTNGEALISELLYEKEKKQSP